MRAGSSSTSASARSGAGAVGLGGSSSGACRADERLGSVYAGGSANTRGELDGGINIALGADLFKTARNAADEILVSADAGDVGGLAASNVGAGDVGRNAAVL